MGEAGRPRGAAGGQPGAGAALPVPGPRSVLPPAQIPAWWRWRRGEPAGPAGREGHRARAAPALGFGIRRVSAAADGEWGPGGGGWGDFRGLPGVGGAPRGDVGSWGRVGAAWALPGAPRPCCGEGKPRTGRPQKVLGIRKEDPGCCCLREERGRGQGRLVPGCVHPHPAHCVGAEGRRQCLVPVPCPRLWLDARHSACTWHSVAEAAADQLRQLIP